MISLTIKDTKTFMSHLLIKDTFDNMLLSEAAIVTGNTYNINGSINRSFFSDDELASLASPSYSQWSKIKPVCFGLIKGNKVPTSLKIIFLLSEGDTSQLAGQTDINPEDINGLFINIRYSDSGLTLVTAGAISNTYDRIMKGAVVDYIGYDGKHKLLRSLTANLADFYVVIGIMLAQLGRGKR